jgi:hypothetical protein
MERRQRSLRLASGLELVLNMWMKADAREQAFVPGCNVPSV